jgi:dTMP kinase
MIISFEGLDNSGKTTQAALLSSELSRRGFKTVVSKELSTEIGEVLKLGFKSKKYSPIMKALLFAADRQERIEMLHNDIDNDTIVIFDRYIHSAIVYRKSEGIGEEWVKSINIHVPIYDIGFYLDISPEESKGRNNPEKDNIHYSIDLLTEIRNAYMNFVEKGELILIDGSSEQNEISKEILKHIDALLGDISNDF